MNEKYRKDREHALLHVFHIQCAVVADENGDLVKMLKGDSDCDDLPLQLAPLDRNDFAVQAVVENGTVRSVHTCSIEEVARPYPWAL